MDIPRRSNRHRLANASDSQSPPQERRPQTRSQMPSSNPISSASTSATVTSNRHRRPGRPITNTRTNAARDAIDRLPQARSARTQVVVASPRTSASIPATATSNQHSTRRPGRPRTNATRDTIDRSSQARSARTQVVLSSPRTSASTSATATSNQHSTRQPGRPRTNTRTNATRDTTSRSSQARAARTQVVLSSPRRTTQVARGRPRTNTTRDTTAGSSQARPARTQVVISSPQTTPQVARGRPRANTTRDAIARPSQTQSPPSGTVGRPRVGPKCVKCLVVMKKNAWIDLKCSHRLCLQCKQECPSKKATEQDKSLNARCPLCEPHELLESLKEEITCSICFEIMERPALYNCGHMNCSQCYDDWFKANLSAGKRTRCPICQAHVVKVIKHNTPVGNIINKLLSFEKIMDARYEHSLR